MRKPFLCRLGFHNYTRWIAAFNKWGGSAFLGRKCIRCGFVDVDLDDDAELPRPERGDSAKEE